MKEQVKVFLKQHNYDEILVKMGITHALGVGLETLKSLKWEDIAEDVHKRHKDDGRTDENGNITFSLITEDFEMELQEIAYQLATMSYQDAKEIIKELL